MDMLRRHWPDLGAVIAMVLVGGLALFGQSLSPVQQLLVLNFVALLIHQFEEYRYPGYFPGQFNGGLGRSDRPDRYPLNTQSSLVVNVILGWPLYVLPILMPGVTWIGLATMLVGFGQVVMHGIVMPIRARAIYGVGILSALLLFLPIGVAYILAARPTGTDWLIALALFPAVGLAVLIAPISFLRSRDSRHIFPEQQLGPYSKDK